MPIHAQLHDGTMLEFPDGTDPAVIQTTVKNVLSSRQEYAQEPPNAAARMGRGMMDFYQGAKQKGLNWMYGNDSPEATQYTKDVNAEIGAYEKGRGPDAGFDWMRLAGNVATPTAAIPLGAGAITGRALLGGLSGGAQSYANFSPENSEFGNAKAAGLGALAGGTVNAAAPKVMDAAMAGAQSMKNALSSAPRALSAHFDATIPVQVQSIVNVSLQGSGKDWSALPQQLRDQFIQDAKDTIAATGRLDAEAIKRKADIIASGMTPTKSMVTRSPADWTTERNLQKALVQNNAGKVDDLTAIYQGNDAAMRGALESAGNATGGAAGTKYATGKQAFDVINKISDDSQKAVSALYKQVREKVGDQTGIGYDNLFQALEGIKDNAFASGIHDSMFARLNRLLGKEQTLTINKAEELRKFLNTLPDNNAGTDLSGFKKVIREAIDNDVVASAGDDFFKGARAAAKDRFQMLHDPAIQRVLKMTGELGEDKAALKWFDNYITNGGPGDINKLRAILTSPEYASNGGNALWNGVRRRTVEWIAQESEGKGGMLSGKNMQDALDKLGPERLQALFAPQELSRIAQYARALKAATYEPGMAAVNHSNTAPTFLKYALGALKVGNALPGIGPLVTEPLTSATQAATNKATLAGVLRASPVDNSARDAAQEAARQRLAYVLKKYGPNVGALPAAGYQGQ